MSSYNLSYSSNSPDLNTIPDLGSPSFTTIYNSDGLSCTTLVSNQKNPLFNGDYVITASAPFTTTNSPLNLFSSSSNEYFSANNYDTNGNYIGDAKTMVDGQYYTGEWIQLQLPFNNKLTSSNIEFNSDMYSTFTYKICGSKDKDTWKELVTGNSETYSYYRLIVNKFISVARQNHFSIIKWKLQFYSVDFDRVQSNIVKLRGELDTKLKEIYNVDSSISTENKIQFDSTMYTGIMWTILATTVLYFTFIKL